MAFNLGSGGIGGGADVKITVAADIAAAKSKLEELSAKVRGVGDSMQAFSQKMSGFTNKMLGGLTAATAALAAAAYKFADATLNVGGDFELSITKLGAITKASAVEMGKMEEKARSLGESLPITASTAAQSMYSLASAGASVNEILSSVNGVVNLAISQNYDLGQTTDVVVATLRSFNMGFNEASHVADVFNNAIRSSMMNMEKFSSAMVYVAKPAHDLGLSLEQTAAMMGVLADSGMRGEQVGTSLRAVLTGLMAPSDEAARALARLGVATRDSSGEMRNAVDIFADLAASGMTAADALAIFDRRSFGAALTLAGSIEKVRKFTDEFGEMGITTELVAKQMDTFPMKMQALKSSIEEGFLVAFEQIQSVSKFTVDSIREMVVEFNAWAKETKIFEEVFARLIMGLNGAVAQTLNFKDVLASIDVRAIGESVERIVRGVKELAVGLSNIVSRIPWVKFYQLMEWLIAPLVWAKIIGIFVGLGASIVGFGAALISGIGHLRQFQGVLLDWLPMGKQMANVLKEEAAAFDAAGGASENASASFKRSSDVIADTGIKIKATTSELRGLGGAVASASAPMQSLAKSQAGIAQSAHAAQAPTKSLSASITSMQAALASAPSALNSTASGMSMVSKSASLMAPLIRTAQNASEEFNLSLLGSKVQAAEVARALNLANEPLTKFGAISTKVTDRVAQLSISQQRVAAQLMTLRYGAMATTGAFEGMGIRIGSVFSPTSFGLIRSTITQTAAAQKELIASGDGVSNAFHRMGEAAARGNVNLKSASDVVAHLAKVKTQAAVSGAKFSGAIDLNNAKLRDYAKLTSAAVAGQSQLSAAQEQGAVAAGKVALATEQGALASQLSVLSSKGQAASLLSLVAAKRITTMEAMKTAIATQKLIAAQTGGTGASLLFANGLAVLKGALIGVKVALAPWLAMAGSIATTMLVLAPFMAGVAAAMKVLGWAWAKFKGLFVESEEAVLANNKALRESIYEMHENVKYADEYKAAINGCVESLNKLPERMRATAMEALRQNEAFASLVSNLEQYTDKVGSLKTIVETFFNKLGGVTKQEAGLKEVQVQVDGLKGSLLQFRLAAEATGSTIEIMAANAGLDIEQMNKKLLESADSLVTNRIENFVQKAIDELHKFDSEAERQIFETKAETLRVELKKYTDILQDLQTQTSGNFAGTTRSLEELAKSSGYNLGEIQQKIASLGEEIGKLGEEHFRHLAGAAEMFKNEMIAAALGSEEALARLPMQELKDVVLTVRAEIRGILDEVSAIQNLDIDVLTLFIEELGSAINGAEQSIDAIVKSMGTKFHSLFEALEKEGPEATKSFVQAVLKSAEGLDTATKEQFEKMLQGIVDAAAKKNAELKKQRDAELGYTNLMFDRALTKAKEFYEEMERRESNYNELVSRGLMSQSEATHKFHEEMTNAIEDGMEELTKLFGTDAAGKAFKTQLAMLGKSSGNAFLAGLENGISGFQGKASHAMRGFSLVVEDTIAQTKGMIETFGLDSKTVWEETFDSLGEQAISMIGKFSDPAQEAAFVKIFRQWGANSGGAFGTEILKRVEDSLKKAEEVMEKVGSGSSSVIKKLMEEYSEFGRGVGNVVAETDSFVAVMLDNGLKQQLFLVDKASNEILETGDKAAKAMGLTYTQTLEWHRQMTDKVGAHVIEGFDKTKRGFVEMALQSKLAAETARKDMGTLAGNLQEALKEGHSSFIQYVQEGTRVLVQEVNGGTGAVIKESSMQLESVKDASALMQAAAKEGFKTLGTVAQQSIKSVGDVSTAAMGGAKLAITSGAISPLESTATAAGKAEAAVSDLGSKTTGVAAGMDHNLAAVQEKVESVAGSFKEMVGSSLAAFQNVAMDAANVVGESAKQMKDDLKLFGLQAIDTSNEQSQVAAQFWQDAGQATKYALEEMATGYKATVEHLITFIEAAKLRISDVTQSLADSIEGVFTRIGARVGEILTDKIAASIVAGIPSLERSAMTAGDSMGRAMGRAMEMSVQASLQRVGQAIDAMARRAAAVKSSGGAGSGVDAAALAAAYAREG